MTTTVTGRIVREVGFATFADLTDAPIVAWPRDGITFDGELDEVTVAAIRDRMESRDDADQAARAGLCEKRDAVIEEPSLETLAALAVATANYVLGD